MAVLLFAVTSASITVAGVIGFHQIRNPALRWTAMLGWVALCTATFGPITMEAMP